MTDSSTESTTLTPQQRLALSRHALRQLMQPDDPLPVSPELRRLQQLEQQELEDAAQRAAVRASNAATAQEAANAAATMAHSSERDAPSSTDPAARDVELDTARSGSFQPLATGVDAVDRAGPRSGARRSRRPPLDGNMRLIGEAALRLLRVWWRRHPAHLALEMAEPALQRVARRHPYELLAISAATGALVVVVKPWRWGAVRRWLRASASSAFAGLNLGALTQAVTEGFSGRRR